MAQLGECALELDEAGLDARAQRLRLRIGHDALRAASEERGADAPLEPQHGAADGRLRHAELFGSLAHRARLAHTDERMQINE